MWRFTEFRGDWAMYLLILVILFGLYGDKWGKKEQVCAHFYAWQFSVVFEPCIIYSLPFNITWFPRFPSFHLSTLSTLYIRSLCTLYYRLTRIHIKRWYTAQSPIRIMIFPRSIILGVLALAAQAIAKSSTGDKVLVVLESGIAKSDYSSFWASLEGEYSIQG